MCGSLQLHVDDSETVRTRIEGRARLLTRQAVQYYGGVPDDYTVIMTNVASRSRFIGCISDVVINDLSVTLPLSLSLSLSVCLSVSVSLSLCLSVCLSVCHNKAVNVLLLSSCASICNIHGCRVCNSSSFISISPSLVKTVVAIIGPQNLKISPP